jgi:hypothetical protein
VTFRVVDYLDKKAGNIVADAAGVAEQQYQCPADQWWLVDRGFVRSNSAAATTLLVFTGGPEPNDEDGIDGSTSGNLDVADNAAPWRVFPGQYLTLRWTGATVGSIAKLHLQGRVLERRP